MAPKRQQPTPPKSTKTKAAFERAPTKTDPKSNPDNRPPTDAEMPPELDLERCTKEDSLKPHLAVSERSQESLWLIPKTLSEGQKLLQNEVVVESTKSGTTKEGEKEKVASGHPNNAAARRIQNDEGTKHGAHGALHEASMDAPRKASQEPPLEGT